MTACDLLEAELALDHLEAELAVELPPHLRAFAQAYAASAPLPAAPPATRRIAAVQNALAHPLLADRARALARLMFPIAIEDDRRVIAARAATPTWDALAALTAARDAAARERFGRGFFDLMHRLLGVDARAVEHVSWPAPIDGWHAELPELPAGFVPSSGSLPASDERIWQGLATRFCVRGTMQLVHADVHARTVVVEPQRHVIVIAPRSHTPASRFVMLHEFGHALAGLLVPAGLPRVVDEAVASYTAQIFEDELAIRARQRRRQLAKALDAIERGDSHARPTSHPPWALWHDPGAQAAYVEAEEIADRWFAIDIELSRALEQGAEALDEVVGRLPVVGTVPAIAAERARIDAATTL